MNKDNDEWYLIKDLEAFTDKVRAIVYNNFGLWNDQTELNTLIDTVKKEEKTDFDKILSHSESLIIIKEAIRTQSSKNKKKIRYSMTDKMFADIIEQLNTRLVSNILTSLVQKGLVDAAYDMEINDFIFWVKEDNDNSKETKTDSN
jgi:Zn-finger nucleic acid-binding protein